MKNRIKMALILIAFALMPLVACDEPSEVDTVRKAVGTVGCANPTARDACGENTHCRIKACQR